MAIVANNDLTRGLRGRVGKWLVFRMVRGKTIASHAPKKPDPRKQSAAQRLTRSTFRDASAWAVRILMDPVKKQYYADIAKAQALPNAYTAAVREYMREVTVRRIKDQPKYCVQTIRTLEDYTHRTEENMEFLSLEMRDFNLLPSKQQTLTANKTWSIKNQKSGMRNQTVSGRLHRSHSYRDRHPYLKLEPSLYGALQPKPLLAPIRNQKSEVRFIFLSSSLPHMPTAGPETPHGSTWRSTSDC
jgi:hypothetical protein